MSAWMLATLSLSSGARSRSTTARATRQQPRTTGATRWGSTVVDPHAHVNADVDDGTEMSRPRLAFLRLDEARLIP